MKIISRNKALLLIGIMLVILGQVGVNYLIYKNKNDKTVNKTKLNLENKKDTFAIMLQQDDGTYKSTYSKSFNQSGYMYNSEKSVCVDAKGQTLDNVLSYNAGTNQMALRSSVTAYCYVYFDQMRIKANDLITLASASEVEYDGTTDNNLRYIGANPNNYIYFNCSDYNNPTASTCEKWRIIGSFNNVENAAYAKKTLFKIIRSESLGTYSWDAKSNGVGSSSATDNSGSNDWSDSQLMLMLNGVSYNNYKSGYTVSGDYLLDKNGVSIMNISGSYYEGSSAVYIPYRATPGNGFEGTATVNFTSTGLKNDTTRGMIEFVMWKLGGSAGDYYDYVRTEDHYDLERGTGVYTGHSTEWAGKVGLMYASDYGYATSGGTTTNREACLARELYHWYSDCSINDWLSLNGSSQWTLTPDSFSSNHTFPVFGDGTVSISTMESDYDVRPTVYLKSNIEIVGGAGSEANPYTIKAS